jgi:hypothetical protein
VPRKRQSRRGRKGRRRRVQCSRKLRIGMFRELLAEAETLDQGAIAIGIFPLQVIEQFATLAHHAQEASTRVVILDMLFKMTGQVVDARREERDLDFRGTRVALNTLIIGHNLGLVCSLDCHGLYLSNTVEKGAAPV